MRHIGQEPLYLLHVVLRLFYDLLQIPDGNTTLKKDDEIVVVSTGKQILALEDVVES